MNKKISIVKILLFLQIILFIPQLSQAFEFEIVPVNPLMTIPFILLLLAIAFIPLINVHFWEKFYPLISILLGLIAVVYYIFILKNPLRMAGSGLEYFGFISLIGSLFVVSGGININIKREATPSFNVFLLAIGSLLANVIGTTGASMVLIRPFININRHRIKPYHIVFFIFLVSNIGGMLTPIGDPPLFIGYLKGIPFFWIFDKVFLIWILEVVVVLLIFYIIDKTCNKSSGAPTINNVEKYPLVMGSHNILFLITIIVAVFLPELIRECIMIIAATLSYYTTRQEIHRRNEFNFRPINEVAILFAGIFATMVPALDWLDLNAAKFGLTRPDQFYWFTGALSAFLDNTPTYLSFLTTAFGLHGLNVDNINHMYAMLGLLDVDQLKDIVALHNSNIVQVTSESWRYIQAISASAVMFGATTYIGNGPNFMVKSIAEQSNIKMPSFMGYMLKYSIPLLIPLFIVVWFLFFY
jgi:Na+/H+ antiporter NhaD/arsenite permease-like protein